ncbi:hypothetical protein [Antrihabitans stalactiti]|uniref:Secreted protein n=1 Tax=Antrihabitans stalactiti TaxID=2584121 RepID=A0A848KMS9_9NOCA|nr:hypothetical protein [Antrihabitans stalactiti]NMN98264.1 hypothetical protein [Antrihabitans stalactiti]
MKMTALMAATTGVLAPAIFVVALMNAGDTYQESSVDRGYTCDATACYWPNGERVINADRCGVRCGEPPTSGDKQSDWNDCIAAKPLEVCREELN